MPRKYEIETAQEASAYYREAESLAPILDQLARIQEHCARNISEPGVAHAMDISIEDLRSELGHHVTALREAADDWRETKQEKIERTHLVRQQL